MKDNDHLTPALSPKGGEGVKIQGNVPAADSRPELFLTDDCKRAACLEACHTLGIDQRGIAHPKMLVRFAREGFQPTQGFVFYQQ